MVGEANPLIAWRWASVRFAPPAVAGSAPSPFGPVGVHKRTNAADCRIDRPHPEQENSVVPAETHVEQPPMDRQAVVDLIRDRLADIL